MSNELDLLNNAGYRHFKYVDTIKRYPLECQGILKNYFQCVETFQGNRANFESFYAFRNECKEKVNYSECLNENFSKIRDPSIRKYNVREIEVEGP